MVLSLGGQEGVDVRLWERHASPLVEADLAELGLGKREEIAAKGLEQRVERDRTR